MPDTTPRTGSRTGWPAGERSKPVPSASEPTYSTSPASPRVGRWPDPARYPFFVLDGDRIWAATEFSQWPRAWGSEPG